MKSIAKTLASLVLLLGISTAAVGTQADADDKKLAKIPAALKGAKYITDARPDTDAEVYYLLNSHSQCAFCVHHTPELIKLYKQMKGKGAELVLLNSDPTDEKARAWAEKAGMNYPVVAPAAAKKIPFTIDLSSGPPPPPPLMIIVTPDGERIGQGGGPQTSMLLGQWKDYVKKAKNSEKRAKVDDEADSEKAEQKPKKKKKKKSKKSKRKKK